MLVAHGPDRRTVVAEETPLEQLQHWSHLRALYCPNCRGIVHVRGGPEKRTQLHFAHQKGECAWSTEAESVRHARGKVVLSHWLREQFPQASITLEERLPEPNRIADIFISHPNGDRWAVEFQCAPLDIGEWQHRHQAYRNASILDIWIIGNNRLEKQEAFIEAIIASAREILFLDPLSTPPRTWLRWPVSRATIQTWHPVGTGAIGQSWNPVIEGWVGRLGYGASLIGQLQSVRLGERGIFEHSARSVLATRTQQYQAMGEATTVDEAFLTTYLRQQISEDALHLVIVPLVRAYLRDPDLLRRYNYGRGHEGNVAATLAPIQPLTEEDRLRVLRAGQWLHSLEQKGFTLTSLQELVNEIPFAGPYTAFVRYFEMLLTLW